MKRAVLTSILAMGLVACGASAQPETQSAETIAALTEKLPKLTGDYVWDMDETQSTLSFEAFYNGNFTGRFDAFQTVINLNPDAPETGEIHAIIDLSSVRVKDSDVQANLPTADWFDVTSHPYATFKSTDISALSGNNFEAKGEMTLKGIKQPATLTFGLELTGTTAHATGGFEISRTDFNIGTGADFETEDWVRFPVTIMVDIKAER